MTRFYVLFAQCANFFFIICNSKRHLKWNRIASLFCQFATLNLVCIYMVHQWLLHHKPNMKSGWTKVPCFHLIKRSHASPHMDKIYTFLKNPGLSNEYRKEDVSNLYTCARKFSIFFEPVQNKYKIFFIWRKEDEHKGIIVQWLMWPQNDSNHCKLTYLV